MATYNGGAAFPYYHEFPAHGFVCNTNVRHSAGMTLRDAFAIGIAADVFGHFSWCDEDIQRAAEMVWKLADAMLAEREK